MAGPAASAASTCACSVDRALGRRAHARPRTDWRAAPVISARSVVMPRSSRTGGVVDESAAPGRWWSRGIGPRAGPRGRPRCRTTLMQVSVALPLPATEAGRRSARPSRRSRLRGSRPARSSAGRCARTAWAAAAPSLFVILRLAGRLDQRADVEHDREPAGVEHRARAARGCGASAYWRPPASALFG